MSKIHKEDIEKAKIKLKEKGLIQNSLSKEIHISLRTISRFFAGENISDDIFKQICDYLELLPQSSSRNPDATNIFSREIVVVPKTSTSFDIEVSGQKGEYFDSFKSATKISHRLSNVPSLPLTFIPRYEELIEINQLLSNSSRVAIVGPGGFGKTLIATSFAQECTVQESFPDGIVWVNLGQETNLILRQRQLARSWGYADEPFLDIEEGRACLRNLAIDKKCLLIVDDVWNAEEFSAFDILGPHCKMLITTRKITVVNAMEAKPFYLGSLNDLQALNLLAKWATEGNLAKLPAQAQQIIEECNNLPLALAMIGAMLKNKPIDRWENVLQKLRNAELEKISQVFPGYSYPNLLEAIQVSVSDLPYSFQKFYLDFAIFPENANIPETVLQRLWKFEYPELNESIVQDIVDEFVDRSLLRRDEKGYLSLHDLQLDYVRSKVNDLEALHNRLLSAYKLECTNGWSTGPNDGYFFTHLAYHLIKAGRRHELYSLLVESKEWINTKETTYPEDWEEDNDHPDDYILDDVYDALAHLPESADEEEQDEMISQLTTIIFLYSSGWY